MSENWYYCDNCGVLTNADEIEIVEDRGLYKLLCPDCHAKVIDAIYKLEPKPKEEVI